MNWSIEYMNQLRRKLIIKVESKKKKNSKYSLRQSFDLSMSGVCLWIHTVYVLHFNLFLNCSELVLVSGISW